MDKLKHVKSSQPRKLSQWFCRRCREPMLKIELSSDGLCAECEETERKYDRDERDDG